MGERRVGAVIINAPDMLQCIHFQVASVHKCFVSVTKRADMVYTSMLKRDGGYPEAKETGEKIPIERQGNLLVFRMMVKGAKRADGPGSGFAHQGWRQRRRYIIQDQQFPVGDGLEKVLIT